MVEVAMNVSDNHEYSNESFAFWCVLKRKLLFNSRDWALTYQRLFAYIFGGFFIGTLYYGIGYDGARVFNNLGLLIFNIMFLTFTAMIMTIQSISSEMPALKKGNFHRYSLKSYYLATTMADILIQTIYITAYVSIVYYSTSQLPEWSRYVMFLIASLFTSFVGQSIGVVIGAAMHEKNNAFLASAMSVIFLLFTSLFQSPRNLRNIFAIASFGQYGLEGSVLATYSYGRGKLPCHQTYCHFRSPLTLLSELELVDGDIGFDIIALVIIFLVMRIFGYIAMSSAIRPSKIQS